MFDITLITMGKLKEKFYISAAAEYAKRLQGYCRFTLLELPEVRLPEDPSPAEIAAGLDKEAELIFQKIPKGAWLCIFTPEGKTLSSEDFADKMKQVKLSEFNTYLTEQIGQPFVWGGQHLKLTPENYVSVISKRESDAQHRADAIAYCKRLFDSGASVLYAYDCSGLGMYYLQNVKKVYSYDMTANSMMKQCTLMDEPKKGYWVFRLDDRGKAVHIGYMVSDTELIEAKGRKSGVVRTKYKASAWNKIGKPKCIEFDEPKPEPKPEQPVTMDFVFVVPSRTESYQLGIKLNDVWLLENQTV